MLVQLKLRVYSCGRMDGAGSCQRGVTALLGLFPKYPSLTSGPRPTLFKDARSVLSFCRHYGHICVDLLCS